MTDVNAHFLFEIFQLLVVSALVLGCTVYCLLSLAPNILKQPLKQVLLRGPLPAFVKTRLQQNNAGDACGTHCGGCASNSANASNPPSSATAHTVKWHPRQR